MRKQASDICPKIAKKLEKLKNESAACIPRFTGDEKFEVTHMYRSQFFVDLEIGSCSCRKWELTGLSCSHAISGLAWKGLESEPYVSHYYSKTTYMQAYEPVISPIDGLEVCRDPSTDALLPPKKIELSGRPKKPRRREPDEVRSIILGTIRLSEKELKK
ncbi:hypothetical protein ACH5RR_031973 [Cinchona calisaya]|uniref:SWIM-type domain-containing protein n=1 Tax=Cinchona calisaya TaxID=153742 RepID=A0ABD2YIQ7_9GENT